MKLRILMVPVILAVLFLITGILYAANGDLIVNGNLGVGTATPTGKAEINGNMTVDGDTIMKGNTTTNGNATVNGTLNVGAGGVKFPDGSTQTTAISPTTQNNVTASRAIGTVYRNPTGKPMLVMISVGLHAATWYINCDANPSPGTLILTGTESSWGSDPFYNGRSATFIVLPNYYYVVTISGGYQLYAWTEWY